MTTEQQETAKELLTMHTSQEVTKIMNDDINDDGAKVSWLEVKGVEKSIPTIGIKILSKPMPDIEIVNGKFVVSSQKASKSLSSLDVEINKASAIFAELTAQMLVVIEVKKKDGKNFSRYVNINKTLYTAKRTLLNK